MNSSERTVAPSVNRTSDSAFDPAEVLGRAFDPRHEVLELSVEGPRVIATLERQHLTAVSEWARKRSLEPVLTVLEPRPGWVAGQHLVRAGPERGAASVTEALLGHDVALLEGNAPEPALEPQRSWVRVRTPKDAYLGWLPLACVSTAPYRPTHVVTALRAHAYAEPQVQASPVGTLSWGSRVALVGELDEAWAHTSLPGGGDAFIRRTLLHPLGGVPVQPVQDAWRGFLGTPYLWGGCTAWGLDCSGLVQLLYRMAGLELPRDADEQYERGTPVPADAARPGDLVAFEGHIGLYLGEGKMVHANAANMAVTVDDFMAQPHLKSIFLGFVRYTF